MQHLFYNVTHQDTTNMLRLFMEVGRYQLEQSAFQVDAVAVMKRSAALLADSNPACKR